MQSLRKENPWFTTDSIGTTSLRPSVRVHSSWLDEASENEWCQARSPKGKQKLRVYTVEAGDVLGTIARRFGVRIEDLRKWNKLHGDLIQVGQNLDIRGGVIPPPKRVQVSSTSESNSNSSSWTWYTVQSGDSYWSIATSHPSVSLSDLLKINHVSPEKLQPGMRIRIPRR